VLQLTSYGGDLSYRITYDVDGFDIPTKDPDVIIEVSEANKITHLNKIAH
jgi:hypothetical protein